jgi:hypothetical protein
MELIEKVKTIHRQATANHRLHLFPPVPNISQHIPPLPALPASSSSPASPRFFGTVMATVPNFLMQSVGMPNLSLNTSNPNPVPGTSLRQDKVSNKQFLQTFLSSIPSLFLFLLFCSASG